MDEKTVSSGSMQNPAASGWVAGDTPDVSVIVPTFNRSDRLQCLLDDLINQSAGPARYEVLVVDNRSADDTAAVVRGAITRDARIRYLYEPAPGASHARNRGIANARGRILAFIDDDVRPAGNWVQAVWHSLTEHPEVDCVGGRVEPRWPCDPPSWLTPRNWGPLALQTGRGDAPYLDRDHASACLVTANFACRAEVFAEIGAFSPDYLRDEDRELNLRLWRAGKRGMYDDSIVTFAEVQRERLTKRYHREWYRVTGESHARLRYREVIDRDGRLRDLTRDARYIFGAPGFLYRELAGHANRWLRLLLQRDLDTAFFEECRIRYLISYLQVRWASALRHAPANTAASGGPRGGAYARL